VQVVEDWSGYVAVGKRMHENSTVVERNRVRGPNFLGLGMGHTVLSKAVEKA
jgi:hypothetical protein